MTYSSLHGPTVLESWDLDNGVKLTKYEALKHTLSSPQRQTFVNEGVLPVECSDHRTYWRDIYSKRMSLPDKNRLFVDTSQYSEEEINQRTSFLQRPVFLAVYNEDKVVGGIWTDGRYMNERKPRAGYWPRFTRTALFHLCLEPEFQGIGLGTSMLEIYEDQMKGKCEALLCGWDGIINNRPEGSGVANYFTNRGYAVKGNDVSGIATKRL